MANLNLPEKAVRQQIASAVDIILQISRLSDGSRRVTHLSEVTGMDQEVVSMQDIYRFEKRGVGINGRVLGRFYSTGVTPRFADKIIASGIPISPNLFDMTVEV
jgi:pilus assembly protein CpaF